MCQQDRNHNHLRHDYEGDITFAMFFGYKQVTGFSPLSRQEDYTAL